MGSGGGALVCALVLVFGASVTSGLKLPSYLKGCRSDATLNDCALKSARDLFKTNVSYTGDRKYHVPIFDPLTITQLKIDQQGLIIDYRDMKMYGLKNIDMKAISLDLKQMKTHYEFVVPELYIESKYTINGKILVVPLAGNGYTNMTMTNVLCSMSHDFGLITKKNGKKHLTVMNGFLSSELGSMTMRMDGLFNGDKTLGDHLNLFLNENWKEVVKEIKPAFNSALAQLADQVFNNLASAVPYNELFLESP